MHRRCRQEGFAEPGVLPAKSSPNLKIVVRPSLRCWPANVLTPPSALLRCHDLFAPRHCGDTQNSTGTVFQPNRNRESHDLGLELP
jgi:hypothetical protein